MAVDLEDKLGNFRLLDAEVGLALENLAHADAVHFLIALRARRPDGGAAAGIEQAELDADGVGDFAHDAAERVDFADEMALGDAADSGVAGHLRDEVEVHGDHGSFEAHARAGAGGLATGVTGADDDDVVIFLHWIDCSAEGFWGEGGGTGKHFHRRDAEAPRTGKKSIWRRRVAPSFHGRFRWRLSVLHFLWYMYYIRCRGAMSKKRMGSSVDDLLKKEGTFEEVQVIKEVVAWQLGEAMRKKKISKARMATLLKTSRTQVDRLLDPKNDITLSSLQRAAAMVGRRVEIELVRKV